MSHDPVNHPTHYTSHPSGVECITVTEHYDFVIGNIIKYAWRAGMKSESSKIQDLEKCLWYAKRAVEREKAKSDDYDAADDARRSYDAAIEAKRQRGDTHSWNKTSEDAE